MANPRKKRGTKKTNKAKSTDKRKKVSNVKNDDATVTIENADHSVNGNAELPDAHGAQMVIKEEIIDEAISNLESTIKMEVIDYDAITAKETSITPTGPPLTPTGPPLTSSAPLIIKTEPTSNGNGSNPSRLINEIDFSVGGFDPSLDNIQLQELSFEGIDTDLMFSDLIASGDFATGRNDLDMYLEENVVNDVTYINGFKVEPISGDDSPEKPLQGAPQNVAQMAPKSIHQSATQSVSRSLQHNISRKVVQNTAEAAPKMVQQKVPLTVTQSMIQNTPLNTHQMVHDNAPQTANTRQRVHQIVPQNVNQNTFQNVPQNVIVHESSKFANLPTNINVEDNHVQSGTLPQSVSGYQSIPRYNETTPSANIQYNQHMSSIRPSNQGNQYVSVINNESITKVLPVRAYDTSNYNHPSNQGQQYIPSFNGHNVTTNVQGHRQISPQNIAPVANTASNFSCRMQNNTVPVISQGFVSGARSPAIPSNISIANVVQVKGNGIRYQNISNQNGSSNAKFTAKNKEIIQPNIIQVNNVGQQKGMRYQNISNQNVVSNANFNAKNKEIIRPNVIQAKQGIRYQNIPNQNGSSNANFTAKTKEVIRPHVIQSNTRGMRYQSIPSQSGSSNTSFTAKTKEVIRPTVIQAGIRYQNISNQNIVPNANFTAKTNEAIKPNIIQVHAQGMRYQSIPSQSGSSNTSFTAKTKEVIRPNVPADKIGNNQCSSKQESGSVQISTVNSNINEQNNDALANRNDGIQGTSNQVVAPAGTSSDNPNSTMQDSSMANGGKKRPKRESKSASLKRKIEELHKNRTTPDIPLDLYPNAYRNTGRQAPSIDPPVVTSANGEPAESSKKPEVFSGCYQH